MHVTANWKENTSIRKQEQSLEQLRDLLHRYCMSLTKSRSDAEDLAQTTWLKVLKSMKGFSHQNLEALLLRIAKNTWIDESRRKSIHCKATQLEKPTMTMPDHGTFEIELAFQVLVKHMSRLQMTVFILRDVLDYSIAEAAVILETTEGAVKAALYRARNTLEAVKNDLVKGKIPLPEEEGLKTYLRALAAAYQIGDIATLVQLSAHGEVDPIVAIGIVQDRVLRNSLSVRHSDCQPAIRMAA